MEGGVTIGELARRSGVATSALRFYEAKGLIHADRTEAGHRRYLRSALRRIAFIVFAQRIGLTLDEIGAELAKLPPGRAPNRRDWSRLSSLPARQSRRPGGAPRSGPAVVDGLSGWPRGDRSRTGLH